MKKFDVIVTRDITESTFVTVLADSAADAEDRALDEVTSPSGYSGTWEVDDCTCGSSAPYVTSVEELK